jgi:hypothetical protein
LSIAEKVTEKSLFWKAGFSPRFLNNDYKGKTALASLVLWILKQTEHVYS